MGKSYIHVPSGEGLKYLETETTSSKRGKIRKKRIYTKVFLQKEYIIGIWESKLIGLGIGIRRI